MNKPETRIKKKGGGKTQVGRAFKAFTLAEVLITLVIIGVIAAITVPTLINEYRMKQYKSGLMKSLSTLNQALLKFKYDEGYATECSYKWDEGVVEPTECRKLYNYFVEHFIFTKICQNNSYQNGCIPKYKGIDTALASKGGSETQIESSIRNCPGWTESSLLGNKASFITADGMIYIPHDNNYYTPMLLVDVNGQKGPNKWGHDLHTLMLYKKSNEAKYDVIRGGCIVVERGGKTGFDLLYK